MMCFFITFLANEKNHAVVMKSTRQTGKFNSYRHFCYCIDIMLGIQIVATAPPKTVLTIGCSVLKQCCDL